MGNKFNFIGVFIFALSFVFALQLSADTETEKADKPVYAQESGNAISEPGQNAPDTNIVDSAVEQGIVNVRKDIMEFLSGRDLWVDGEHFFFTLLNMAILLLSAFLLNFVLKLILNLTLGRLANKSKYKWIKPFKEKKFLSKLVNIAPCVLIAAFIPVIPNIGPKLGFALYKLSVALVMAMSIRALLALLDIVKLILDNSLSTKNRALSSFIQGLKIVLVLIGSVLILSGLIAKDPIVLLTGLGASAAILMLIFKDTILGLVAGVQFSANDLVRIGDWITVPKYNADGDVIEISLTAVKVRNFDNTVTVLPPYVLVSESFQNWRPMSETGGRRVKRSINIDMRSICLCTPEMLAKFSKIEFLKDYLATKKLELGAYNKEHNIDDAVLVNGRRQTNIGVFRAYIQEYLKRNADVNHDMTCMVRQLQASEMGLPLELYFFTSDVRWVNHENIQSDVFDHLYSILPEFYLRAYQRNAGPDLIWPK